MALSVKQFYSLNSKLDFTSKAKANLRANIAKTKKSRSAGELEKHIKSVKSPKDSKGDVVARAVVVFRGRKMNVRPSRNLFWNKAKDTIL